MADEEAAEDLGVEDLVISTSSSSLPINVTCIFLNASSDLTCSNNNLTEEADDVVYPYKVRFTGGFVQPPNNLAASLQSYADILAAAIPAPFHPPLPSLNSKLMSVPGGAVGLPLGSPHHHRHRQLLGPRHLALHQNPSVKNELLYHASCRCRP